jgi:ribonuclease R
VKKEKFEQRKNTILALLEDSNYRPMRLRDMAVLLNIPKPKRKDLYKVIDALEAEGKISVGRDGRIRKEEGVYQEGTFLAHPKGFGFVEVEGEEEDIFVPENCVHQAMHQDKVRVLVKEEKNGKRREGSVVKVLEHGITEVVGTYQRNRNYGFVIPDNHRILNDIFIPREVSMEASHGDKVVVQLTSYGSQNKSPEGKVTEVLGSSHEPGVDILSIARSYGIPSEFPPKVMNASECVPDHVLETDFQGRLDLRDWTVVTIDGEDAKDLDDGISLTEENGIYHLGVHIADVSNYVQGGSALDEEALKRGTSVYLVDRVIPMLPKRLSNGICSLNQGEDRLALSCLMEINKHGKVVHHQIAETVIRVRERMTYTDVKDIIEDTSEEAKNRYRELIPLFHRMAELSKILRQKRHRRGAIDFDFPECKIILSPKGRPVEIKAYERNVATDLIEDFMLLANETVAQEFFGRGLPFVYRTHETPDGDKVESLLTLLHNQGLKVQKEKEQITPLEIQKVLEQIEGRPDEPLISRLTLRTMKQAKYTVQCSGHFGLAAKYYCHFTSPIRRYPDLQIHRIIKDQIRGRMTPERVEQYTGILEHVATQSSAMERRAEEAERETVKLKKAEYMAYHLGEVFEGMISGVTGWGLYVELPNTIEGLVHVNTLRDDYYVFREDSYELVGEVMHKSYRLGQKVRVRVADVDTAQKTIDFVLQEEIVEDEERENG